MDEHYDLKKSVAYLGDGVYLFDEGFQVVLVTQRSTGQHYIALGGDEMAMLVRITEKLGMGEVLKKGLPGGDNE